MLEIFLHLFNQMNILISVQRISYKNDVYSFRDSPSPPLVDVSSVQGVLMYVGAKYPAMVTKISICHSFSYQLTGRRTVGRSEVKEENP